MKAATDVGVIGVVKNACYSASGACTHPLVIFRVARFSETYKQDLRGRYAIAMTNSRCTNGHNFVEQF